MQIPIMSGIWSDSAGDVRAAYPVNYLPVPGSNGISDGYLRPAEGLVTLGSSSSGVSRGAIFWNGTHYRVMGSQLCSVSPEGNVLPLGEILGSGPVTMDYSFDCLSISAGGFLYYFNGSTISLVTDPDLGASLDHAFLDGYFVSTDGESVVVTELNDRTSVNPLKYGSSELDPDPVVGIVTPRQELHVINRHTIEVFENVGGTLFPFRVVSGAQIMKGAVSASACCEFLDSVAFLGGGRNEAPSIYLGANSQAIKIAPREIDLILSEYTEDELKTAVVQKRMASGMDLLYVRLPDQTLVYDAAMSKAIQYPAWSILKSGSTHYRADSILWAHNRWWCGDTTSGQVGYLSDEVSSHWTETVPWEFSTAMVYNEGRGGIVHELELVALPGRSVFGIDPYISTAYSVDGRTWSVDKPIRAGVRGNYQKRLTWLQQGMFRNYRIQRFRGDSRAHLSVLRLEARLEPLAH